MPSWSGPIPLSCSPRPTREFTEASAESVVIERVRVSPTDQSFTGLVSSPTPPTCLSSERTICFCSSIRPRSLPSPTPCRVRTKASACLPSRWCSPGWRSRPLSLSWMGTAVVTVAPPTASTSRAKPAKSTST